MPKHALVLLLLSLAPVHAWSDKGHQMQVRAALRTLPAELPDFFRRSAEQLIFVGMEPDRWRTPETPGLTEATGPNHVFAYELAPTPFPPTRHAFLIHLVKSGRLQQPDDSLRQIGFGPWAVQESAEMLTSAFRRWRAMAPGADKRQLEQNIIFMAGVLAHWAGDLSQPMHCSIHMLGWSPQAPNPAGYTTNRDIHGRYEADYVNRAITDADVQSALAGLPATQEIAVDWLEHARRQVQACNRHIERLYQWDQQSAFGGGAEAAEAKRFTALRLAEGAKSVQEIWLTAWRRSGRPIRPSR
jgi:hypothetical protein